ncbi:MAG: hypothetical protein M3R04_05845 [bacterium]|nr:hypothetical protein [bacterium]
MDSLSVVERKFLGLLKAPDGPVNHYQGLINIVDEYVLRHGYLPNNGAQIALAQSDPDAFIAANPRLVNLATGHLYEAFESRNFTPLGIWIEAKPAPSSLSSDLRRRWHLRVWGEKPGRFIVDTTLVF